MAEASGRTALYRHFDEAGSLLYVGISMDPHRRTATHLSASEWRDLTYRMTAEFFPSRELAIEAERMAISMESPRYNVSGTDRPRKRRSVEQRQRQPKPEPQPYTGTRTARADVRAWLRANRIRQRELAKRVGIKPEQMCRILKSSVPGRPVRMMVALVTGLNVEDTSSWT